MVRATSARVAAVCSKAVAAWAVCPEIWFIASVTAAVAPDWAWVAAWIAPDRARIRSAWPRMAARCRAASAAVAWPSPPAVSAALVEALISLT